MAHGRALLRTERVSLNEDQYRAALLQNGGHLRFVTVGDLVA